MRRRIMAMLVAVTGLVVLSMSGDASPAAATAAAPTSAPSATAAAPTLYCAAGIAGQVCDAVLGPICQNRCLASTSATRTAAAPAFTCEPGLFATICQIVFAPFCTVHHCYAAASSSAAASSRTAAPAAAPTAATPPSGRTVQASLAGQSTPQLQLGAALPATRLP